MTTPPTPTTIEKVREQVREVIAVELDLEQIPGDQDTLEGLGADSLDREAVIIALESEFDLLPLGDKADKAKTVADFISVIQKELTSSGIAVDGSSSVEQLGEDEGGGRAAAI